MVWWYALSPPLKGRWNVASWSYLAYKGRLLLSCNFLGRMPGALVTHRLQTSLFVVPNRPSSILENGNPRSSDFSSAWGSTLPLPLPPAQSWDRHFPNLPTPSSTLFKTLFPGLFKDVLILQQPSTQEAFKGGRHILLRRNEIEN